MVDSGAITRITLVHFPVRCRGGGWGGLGGEGKSSPGQNGLRTQPGALYVIVVGDTRLIMSVGSCIFVIIVDFDEDCHHHDNSD